MHEIIQCTCNLTTFGYIEFWCHKWDSSSALIFQNLTQKTCDLLIGLHHEHCAHKYKMYIYFDSFCTKYEKVALHSLKFDYSD